MKERKLLPSDSPNLLDRVAQRSFGEATHFPNVGSLQMKLESYIPKTHQADVGKKGGHVLRLHLDRVFIFMVVKIDHFTTIFRVTRWNLLNFDLEPPFLRGHAETKSSSSSPRHVAGNVFMAMQNAINSQQAISSHRPTRSDGCHAPWYNIM